jgi:hypothetical protein
MDFQSPSETESLEKLGENATGPNTGLNPDLERKLQGTVCRQVVAGPRNHARRGVHPLK